MNKRSGDDYGNRMFMISNPLNYTAEHTTEWDGFWRRGDDYGNRMFIISNPLNYILLYYYIIYYNILYIILYYYILL